MTKEKKRENRIICLILNFIILFPLLLIYACTASITFQNISTNGKAQDVVDDDDAVRSDISPSFTAPILK